MSERVTGLGPGSEVTDVAKFDVLPVAASDLVAWYPFRSGTGEDLTAGDSRFGDSTDYSATVNGATFQASGGVTDIQTGANSGAFGFDGTDDELANVKGLSGTQFTFLAQVKVSAANSDFGRIYSSRKGSAATGVGLEARSQSDKLVASVEANGTRQSVGTSFSGIRNTFTQVGVRYDGQTLELIRSASVAAATSATVSPPENDAKLGMRPGGVSSERFGGIIDSVRLYDAVLSDSQIAQHNQNASP